MEHQQIIVNQPKHGPVQITAYSGNLVNEYTVITFFCAWRVDEEPTELRQRRARVHTRPQLEWTARSGYMQTRRKLDAN